MKKPLLRQLMNWYAFENKDFSTFNFLQWYVAEQHEEENLFQSIIDKFELLGNEAKNLYFLDNEIAGNEAKNLYFLDNEIAKLTVEPEPV